MLARNSGLGVLFKVLGRRPFVVFSLVTGLVVFLLAAVTVTSRYAMQRYVADQVERVPWDLSIYQTAEVPLADQLRDGIAGVRGIAAAERLVFLRTIPPYSTQPKIDGQALRAPWLSLLTATQPSLLPPDIRPTTNGAVLVLVGSKSQMGDAYLRMQNKKKFELVFVRGEVQGEDAHGHTDPDSGDEHDDTQDPALAPVITLSTPIERVIRVDSTELNRWFLEQTSSPTLVPELGLILVTNWNPQMVSDFDQVSRGFIHTHSGEEVHGDPGKYFPDVIHLVRVDRDTLVSGWDIDGSLRRVVMVGSQLTDNVQDITASAAVDHNLGAMFVRINDIARKIALISLLVSLPLLLIAGVLLANLTNLLLLNERRRLGLLRLRGVSGRAIGTALLLAIGAGGLFGGLIGAGLGTIIPLTIYYGGIPPFDLIPKIQQPLSLGLFLAVGIAISLATGWRLVRQASRMSPLEASRRVSGLGEAGTVRFGVLQFLALLIGGAKFAGWVFDRTLASYLTQDWLTDADRMLDFVSFPLLIYGLVSLIASRQRLMSALIAPLVWIMAGRFRTVALRHMEIRRHRAAGFLLIVALLTSIALYPTVMTAVFDNKTERGARVQLGGDVQVTLNALDMMQAEMQSRGGLRERLAALQDTLDPVVARLRALPQIRGVAVIVEGLVEGLYMPDRGFSGLPMYLIGDTRGYLDAIYSEPQLGEQAPFGRVIEGLDGARVGASTPVGRYYKRSFDQPMPSGRTVTQAMARAPYGGALHFLPGVPLRTVNDREGFIGARVDYLNHLFASSPYLVAAGDNEKLAQLDVLIPRVVLSIARAPGVGTAELRQAVATNLGIQALDIRDIETEIARLGSDMYIYLARQNVQIYLFGGLVLALIGIFAVAYANYVEDRRTLALLRIRGAGPADVVRFFLPNVFGPSLVGLVVGGLISLGVGFGITKLIWDLRQLQTVMNYLPTRLAVSEQTATIAAVLLLLLVGIVLLFGRWVFARTARQSLLEG
jgi:ABC-type lipoprotein release transport system permease subunit